MENKKRKQHTVKPGLILVVAWIMAASLVFSISAATSDSGSSNGIAWSWQATKTGKTEAGGSGSANVTVTVAESADTTTYTLVYMIGATSHAQTVTNDTDCWGNATTTWNQDASDVTVTATITNNTGSPLKVGGVSIEKGLAIVGVDSENTTISVGGTFTIQLTASAPSDANDEENTTTNNATDTVTITLSTVSNLKVTYYGATNASYTYNGVTLDGASISTTVEVSPDETITLPSAPTVTSGTFAGWRIGHDGSLLDAGATVTVNNDTSIYPVITVEGQVAPFTVNDTPYMFWTDAAKAAGSSGTIILNQTYKLPTTSAANGVSPAGSPYITITGEKVNYIIPNGVKLLIPYSTDNATSGGNFDTKPDTDTTSDAFANSQYVWIELTVPNNTAITCYGQICVDSTIFMVTLYSGSPTGPYGRIVLEEGATLNMKSGGVMYCYGYITGVWDSTSKTYTTGTVTAESGSTIYESFQALGWRGGSLMSKWNSSGAKSFAFADYAVQNIEANLSVQKGATLNFVASTKGYQVEGTFIGNGSGFFQMGEGASVYRSYDPHNNRIRYDLYGNATVANISLSLERIGSIDSKDYILGVNHSMDIVVKEGAEVELKYNFKLMPGSTITIENKARVTVSQNLYIYDTDDYVIDGQTYAHHQSYTWLKSVPVCYISATGYTSNGFTSNGGGFANGISQISSSTPSGKIVVNGDLTINGAVFTTSQGGTSADKIITGTGTITNNSTTATGVKTGVLDEAFTVYASSASVTLHDKAVTPAVGLIAGLSTSDTDYRCFEAGKTYYGSEDGYWYQYTVSTQVPGGTSQIVGYVGNGSTITFDDSNVATGLTAANGSFTYKPNGYVVTGVTGGEDNVEYTDNENGTYTVTTVTADATLTCLIKIMATNIKAGDGLDLYFYVLQSAIEDSDYQAVLTRSYAGADPEAVTIGFADWEAVTNSGTAYYRFCYSDIAAKEMTDEVNVVIKVGDTQVSNSCTESIRNYALRTFGTGTDELDTALMDMLNYGAAAQTYFGYNTDNLANAEDDGGIIAKYAGSATQADTVIPENNLFKGENLVAVSVSAKNKLMLTFYFSNITPDMTATITYTNHSGANVSYEVLGSDFIEYNGWYGIDITGLAIADGRQVVSCEVKNDGTLVASAKDSVEGYIARNYQDGEFVVLDMLIRFVNSAYNLFH